MSRPASPTRLSHHESSWEAYATYIARLEEQGLFPLFDTQDLARLQIEQEPHVQSHRIAPRLKHDRRRRSKQPCFTLSDVELSRYRGIH